MQFDTLETEENITNPTIRESREASTYGVETTIDIQQLKNIKKLIVKTQQETIRIITE